MKRRNFALAATTTLTGAIGTKTASAGVEPPTRQYVEWRRYIVESVEQQQALEAFLKDVELPALNRIGIGSVGVFKEMAGEGLSLYMLIPHPSLESFASLSDRLAKDLNYLKDGDPILNTTKKNAPYVRIEGSLMKAFDRLPSVMVPEKKSGRIYELRQYESACFVAAQNKIEMFNEGGEIDIFLETGLDPVFFGESLSGSQLPNLTYMLSFEDMAAHDAHWDAFKNHPEWNRIKAIPKYKGTVSNITKTFLLAAPYSQI